MHLLYIWEVSSLAPSCTQEVHLWPSWSGNANQLLAKKVALNTAWRPYEVGQLFSRSIALTHSYWGIFTAKPRHGHVLFHLWVYQPTFPCPTISPKDMLEVTSQIIDIYIGIYAVAIVYLKLKVSWWDMQTLVVKELTANTSSAWFQASWYQVVPRHNMSF